MAFSFDLETWFKITSHPLPKGPLWVKYEQNWAKGRYDMLRKRDLGPTDGRTDGRTNRLITLGRRQSGALIQYSDIVEPLTKEICNSCIPQCLMVWENFRESYISGLMLLCSQQIPIGKLLILKWNMKKKS